MGARGYCLVVTSDKVYRGVKRDEVTPLVEELLAAKGRSLVWKTVLPNRVYEIRRSVESLDGRCTVILVTGGTGPSPRDVSIMAVEPLAVKRLPGLGEEFRRRSLERVGMRALLSSAEAYVLPKGSLVFVSPGSPDAVRTALEMLLSIDDHLEKELTGEGHL